LITVNKTYEATLAGPRALCIASLANPGTIILPDPSTVPLGGPHFSLSNIGSNSINVVSRPGLGTIRSLANGGSIQTTVLSMSAGARDVSRNINSPFGLFGGSSNAGAGQVALGFSGGTDNGLCYAFQDTLSNDSVIDAVRLKWSWHANQSLTGIRTYRSFTIDQDDCAVFAQSGTVSFPATGFALVAAGGPGGSYGEFVLPASTTAGVRFTLSDALFTAQLIAWRSRTATPNGKFFGIYLVTSSTPNMPQYQIKSYEQGAAIDSSWIPTLEVDWHQPGAASLTCFTIEGETGSDAANVGTRLWRLVR
jgi:hypothetical protein